MKKIMLIISTLLLTSCASPYQPCGIGGGYSETQIDTNIFRVSFRGNGYTNPERAADLCLLRSAVITKQSGFNYFIIIDSSTHEDYATMITPKTATTTTNTNTLETGTISNNNLLINSSGNSTSTTQITGGNTYIISRPTSTNTIVCFKEKPATALSYNADMVIINLSQQYNIILQQ